MVEKVDTNVPDSDDIAQDLSQAGAAAAVPKGSKLKDFLRAGIADPNYDKTGNNQKSTLGPAGEPSPDFTEGTNDISSKSRRMFGKYLSNSTSGNVYPVATPVDGQEAFDVSSRGPNASLVDPSNNGQNVFVSSAENKFSNNLKSYGLGVSNESSRGTFFDDSQLSSFLSKLGDNETLSGHTLLKDVPPSGVSQGLVPVEASEVEARGLDIVKHIHDNLVEVNRLNPADPDPVVESGEYGSKSSNNGPFIRDPNATQEDEALRGIFTVQRDLGKFHRNPEPGGSGEVVTAVEMSRRALSIMLKAGNNFVGSDEVLASGATSVVREFIFSEIVKIPDVNVIDLRMSATDPNGKGQATGQSDLIPGIVSNPDSVSVTRKQLNSYLEPFDDLTKPGMLFSSLTAILSVIVTALAASLLIAGVKAIGRRIDYEFSPIPNRDPRQPYELTFGRNSRQEENDSFLSNLGSTLIRALKTVFGPTETDNNFLDCVPAGMAAIFGFPNVNPNDFVARLKSGGVQSLVDIIFNVLSAPGYYANFLRIIISDNIAVTKAFSNISSSSPESVISSVRALTTSNIYRFIMVSAGVGDAVLKSNGSGLTRSPDDYFVPRERQKNVNPDKHVIKLEDVNSSGGGLGIIRQRISRWGDGRNPQSLTTYVAAQKGLYPEGFDFGEKVATRGLTPSRENIERIENSIESEYMPFYVHDLRTHEIISLPAFITDFGESFSVSYNSVKGMGRQDAVRMYQETERQINISFMLISFNSSDHDHMWMTINKLIAMCYPQYSKGRIRQLGGNENLPFIQPFSQVPAASPMIRLRLGDVFKSNYSKFGLARLFGASSGVGLTDEKKAAEIAAAQEEVKLAEAKAESSYLLQWKQALSRSRKNSKTNVVVKKGSLISHPKGMLRVLADIKSSVYAKDSTVAIPTTFVGTIAVDDIKKFCYYPSDLPNDPVSLTALNGLTFNVGIADIGVDSDVKNEYVAKDSEVSSAKQRLQNAQDAKYPEDFFNSSKNSVVRSFESTRGRGVAGFITNIGLNYDINKIMWDVTPGKRAPQAVTITMGFSPIMDLPLGLDYDGYMRNPSHPVGKMAGSFGDVYGDITLKSSGFSASPIRGASENVEAAFAKAKNEAQSTLDDLTRP